ncbi:MAG: adenine deaminase [Chitinophagaceae bacterium]|nr:adenine deaminase [Chitinophagaceae bacterium]
MNVHNITGNFVDILNETIYPAVVNIVNGKINAIERLPNTNSEIPHSPFILPGFIDSHVHIESSMLIPSEFARLAVVHGTVATVSDPHEIANVCGMEGVEFMILNGKTVPFKFFFGAPSCVPATTFESAGASISPANIEALLGKEEILYLSEMMNFPGVIHRDPQVLQKIEAARKAGKPIDGHAPGLRGNSLEQYIEGGFPGEKVITTDHECFTEEEAREKLQRGMKILIREGSAAKNFEALIPLLHEFPNDICFCSDDKHPDSLVAGHINQLCSRAVAKGIDIFKILRAACINPVRHYKLPVGTLQVGDPADLILVNDLKDFVVSQTYINGILVMENGQSLIPHPLHEAVATHINNFNCKKTKTSDYILRVEENDMEKRSILFPVIEALDGQLITNRIDLEMKVIDGNIIGDQEKDILKIVVVNRYKPAPVAKAFIRNFGFTHGAIASSVAHDSHNIVAVGIDDEQICEAVNLVIEEQGGISCVGGGKHLVVGLPVAGLMSHQDGKKVAEAYTQIDLMAKALGSSLSSPFMTLSFMALLVIPHLKLSDKGLFDGDKFEFVLSAQK